MGFSNFCDILFGGCYPKQNHVINSSNIVRVLSTYNLEKRLETENKESEIRDAKIPTQKRDSSYPESPVSFVSSQSCSSPAFILLLIGQDAVDVPPLHVIVHLPLDILLLHFLL